MPVVRDGRIERVLSAGFKPEALSRVLAAHHTAFRTGIVSVVDRSHVVLSRTRDEEKWVGRRATPQYVAMISDKSEGLGKTVTLEGQEVYVAFTRIPEAGWTVGVAVSAADVEGPLQRAIVRTAILGLLLLAASIAAAVFVGRRIARPITTLAGAASDMAHGRPVVLPADVRVKEIAALAAALQRASDAVRERDELAERERKALHEADAAKSQFLAMLSHELRNPLSALTSAAEILRWTGGVEDRAGTAVQIVERQTRHMARMIEELLDISLIATRRLRLRREPFDLAEAVARTVDTWQQTGRFKDRRVTLDLQQAWAYADPHRTEQVLASLLDNAVKFSAPHSSIRVEVAGGDSQVTLTVADEGAGLTPEFAQRMFEPFVQGEQGIDRALGGMGLGLALVKQLVELQGGSVEAASAGPGRGAKFCVRLPAADEERAAADIPARRRDGKGWRILIVEDNGDARRSLRTLLELAGHEIHEAPDGASAVRIARELRPDAALVDIGLPDIDGYSVAREIRAIDSAQPIVLIAVTGYGQPEDRRKAFEAGFHAHLTKPVTLQQLEGALYPRLAMARAARK